MKKMGIILCVIVMIFVVSFFVSKKFRNCEVSLAGKRWNIELATTPGTRTLGLMNRKSLCERCGMLFIFDGVTSRSFWMKNTLIPLDMYFYDNDGKLVDSVKNMRPEKETMETMQYTSHPAQFVLEVNAGSHLFQPEAFDPKECL